MILPLTSRNGVATSVPFLQNANLACLLDNEEAVGSVVRGNEINRSRQPTRDRLHFDANRTESNARELRKRNIRDQRRRETNSPPNKNPFSHKRSLRYLVTNEPLSEAARKSKIASLVIPQNLC